MEKLKVGDKVCLVTPNRFGEGCSYNFATVERLTKTLAVLSNGKKLINEPKLSFSEDNYAEYRELGNKWEGWQLQTDEIIEKANAERQLNKARAWFLSKKFTRDEILKIYNHFEQLNIL